MPKGSGITPEQISQLYPQEVVERALEVCAATVINTTVHDAVIRLGGYLSPAARPLLKAIQT